jgi:hypothetical protein
MRCQTEVERFFFWYGIGCMEVELRNLSVQARFREVRALNRRSCE